MCFHSSHLAWGQVGRWHTNQLFRIFRCVSYRRGAWWWDRLHIWKKTVAPSRAAERHRTGGGLSKVAGRIKAQWSSCNWVIFGQVDHWKSLELCRGRWLCHLWSPFQSSGSALWKWYWGLLNSMLPSSISRLHCLHVFSSLLRLKISRNFPEANMGVSPMKRREASEVKVRRVTTGRAKQGLFDLDRCINII